MNFIQFHVHLTAEYAKELLYCYLLLYLAVTLTIIYFFLIENLF